MMPDDLDWFAHGDNAAAVARADQLAREQQRETAQRAATELDSRTASGDDPFTNLFDGLNTGQSIDSFLDGFTRNTDA